MVVADTNILLWDALAPERLSRNAAQVLNHEKQQGEIVVSDITLWEIAMLIQNGRVQVETEIQRFLNLLVQSRKLIVQSITPQIATVSVRLPATVNQDPADRLIMATAIVIKSPLITADRNLRKANLVPTIW